MQPVTVKFGSVNGSRSTYLGERVLSEASVKDSVRDLITAGMSVECSWHEVFGRTHQILSGCPSPTDSEVKRKLPFWGIALVTPFEMAIVQVV